MQKVIIAGSINMDIVAETINQPQTGETVFASTLKYYPGGKGANQAVAAAKSGAHTRLIGKVGTDGFGKDLLAFLNAQGIDTIVSTVPDVPTGTALITVSTSNSDNTIVVFPGANFSLLETDVQPGDIGEGDILVSQFEIPAPTIEAFFAKGKEKNTINILNPAPARQASRRLLELTDVLVLNETELAVLANQQIDIDEDHSITAAIAGIKSSASSIIITLGKKGAIGFIGDGVVKVEGKQVKAVDTTGAGDCFVGALAAKLAQGDSLAEAIEFANVAASICVTRQGAGPSMPTLEEINKVFKTV